ncbi:hypothetical protein [Fibrobacter sp. UWH1]|uniref:hypothetical protein n=1 Tax=Fibrobacter sp. UWH1 TaxID=1964354 RepID=UPI000B525A44|nr:hypothetical protein [Fibrobacter sp. UWH1]OWV15571.1 hypothetical protein B7992_04085 [Fibrobacter sp. UWH1]
MNDLFTITTAAPCPWPIWDMPVASPDTERILCLFNLFVEEYIPQNKNSWNCQLKCITNECCNKFPIGKDKCRVLFKCNGEKGMRKKAIGWNDERLREIHVPIGTRTIILSKCGTFLNEKQVQVLMVIIGLIGNLNAEELEAGRGKRLSSKVLERLCVGIMPYKKAIDILLDEGLIIVRNDYSVAKHLCREYSLAPFLAKRGKRLIQLDHIKPNGYHLWPRKVQKDNELVSYLLWSYESVLLPSIEEVTNRAKELSDSGYIRNGRQLVYNPSDDEYDEKNVTKGSFNEDIEEYKKLLKYGLIRPHRTVNCPRVFDSFNGLRKWIRQLITIDNDEIAELDFTALHPNLMFLALLPFIPYWERDYFLQHLSGDVHGNLAVQLHSLGFDLNIDKVALRDKVKQEHLAYFNDRISHIAHYKVDAIYGRKMPRFMKLVRQTKVLNNLSYKNTSDILISMEVALMTNICRELRYAGIRGLYVFDALYVPQSKKNAAINIMNDVAARIHLTTKVNFPKFTTYVEQTK